NETLFGLGTTVNQAAIKSAIKANNQNPTAASAAALVALGFPASCIDSNNFATPFVATNQTTGVNAATGGPPAGSVCFPAVNTGTWSAFSNGAWSLLPDCTNRADSKVQGKCAAFGGEFYPDGKPDTYKDPKREYEAVEFEVNKSFSHGWALSANYRISQLRGNYEGAFRNDNGQSDPGISSLFDFTTGSLGLLGDQFAIGFLNTDRRHILNNFISYNFSSGFLKNLTLGTGIRIETGVPLNDLRAHPVYQNGGEVPFGGRGALGRTPTTGEGDLHAEYK